MRRQFFGIFLLSFVSACFPSAPNTSSPQSPAPTAAPIQPSAIPSSMASVLPPDVTETIQQILTSGELALLVNEELMLIGNVRLSSGRTVSFDDLENLLQIDNQNPELLQLDVQSRLVKALKSGLATVLISARQNPELKVPVKITITAPASGIGANEALVDLEIK